MSQVMKTLLNEKVKPRVLIVENDARTAAMHKQNLERWGYQPILATGIGEALFRDAQAKANEYACHIALLDMHLLDDYDEADKSGLDLAPKLKPTLSIIVSGSGNDRQTVLEALAKEAVDFVGKEEPLSRLQHAIRAAAVKMYACDNGAVVRMNYELVATIMNNLAPGKPSQIMELLKMLFPDTERLFVEMVEQLPNKLALSLMGRAIVLRVVADDKKPVIVKLQTVHKIDQEIANYRIFIEQRLSGRSYIRMLNYCKLWNLGGIVYNLLEQPNEFRRFSEVYQQEESETVVAIIQLLLSKNSSELYQKFRRTSTSRSLFSIYCDHWGSGWVDVLQQFCEHPETLSAILSTCPDLEAINALRWCLEKFFSGDIQQGDESYTHGDLVGDNIFVDNQRQSVLVDYDSAGYYPVYQDFAVLELDIITRLTEISVNNREFAMLCEAMVKSLLPEFPFAESFNSDAGIYKAFVSIKRIRKIANELKVSSHDGQLYYWCLLINSLFRFANLFASFAQMQARPAKMTEQEQAELVRTWFLCNVICEELYNRKLIAQLP